MSEVNTLLPKVVEAIDVVLNGWVPKEEITEESALIGDLGMDSLDRIELIIALEREFDISIADAEFEEKCKTVKDVCNYIDALTT